MNQQDDRVRGIGGGRQEDECVITVHQPGEHEVMYSRVSVSSTSEDSSLVTPASRVLSNSQSHLNPQALEFQPQTSQGDTFTAPSSRPRRRPLSSSSGPLHEEDRSRHSFQDARLSRNDSLSSTSSTVHSGHGIPMATTPFMGGLRMASTPTIDQDTLALPQPFPHAGHQRERGSRPHRTGSAHSTPNPTVRRLARPGSMGMDVNTFSSPTHHAHSGSVSSRPSSHSGSTAPFTARYRSGSHSGAYGGMQPRDPCATPQLGPQAIGPVGTPLLSAVREAEQLLQDEHARGPVRPRKHHGHGHHQHQHHGHHGTQPTPPTVGRISPAMSDFSMDGGYSKRYAKSSRVPGDEPHAQPAQLPTVMGGAREAEEGVRVEPDKEMAAGKGNGRKSASGAARKRHSLMGLGSPSLMPRRDEGDGDGDGDGEGSEGEDSEAAAVLAEVGLQRGQGKQRPRKHALPLDAQMLDSSAHAPSSGDASVVVVDEPVHAHARLAAAAVADAEDAATDSSATSFVPTALNLPLQSSVSAPGPASVHVRASATPTGSVSTSMADADTEDSLSTREVSFTGLLPVDPGFRHRTEARAGGFTVHVHGDTHPFTLPPSSAPDGAEHKAHTPPPLPTAALTDAALAMPPPHSRPHSHSGHAHAHTHTLARAPAGLPASGSAPLVDVPLTEGGHISPFDFQLHRPRTDDLAHAHARVFAVSPVSTLGAGPAPPSEEPVLFTATTEYYADPLAQRLRDLSLFPAPSYAHAHAHAPAPAGIAAAADSAPAHAPPLVFLSGAALLPHTLDAGIAPLLCRATSAAVLVELLQAQAQPSEHAHLRSPPASPPRPAALGGVPVSLAEELVPLALADLHHLLSALALTPHAQTASPHAHTAVPRLTRPRALKTAPDGCIAPAPSAGSSATVMAVAMQRPERAGVPLPLDVAREARILAWRLSNADSIRQQASSAGVARGVHVTANLLAHAQVRCPGAFYLSDREARRVCGVGEQGELLEHVEARVFADEVPCTGLGVEMGRHAGDGVAVEIGRALETLQRLRVPVQGPTGGLELGLGKGLVGAEEEKDEGGGVVDANLFGESAVCTRLAHALDEQTREACFAERHWGGLGALPGAQPAGTGSTDGSEPLCALYDLDMLVRSVTDHNLRVNSHEIDPTQPPHNNPASPYNRALLYALLRTLAHGSSCYCTSSKLLHSHNTHVASIVADDVLNAAAAFAAQHAEALCEAAAAPLRHAYAAVVERHKEPLLALVREYQAALGDASAAVTGRARSGVSGGDIAEDSEGMDSAEEADRASRYSRVRYDEEAEDELRHMSVSLRTAALHSPNERDSVHSIEPPNNLLACAGAHGFSPLPVLATLSGSGSGHPHKRKAAATTSATLSPPPSDLAVVASLCLNPSAPAVVSPVAMVDAPSSTIFSSPEPALCRDASDRSVPPSPFSRIRTLTISQRRATRPSRSSSASTSLSLRSPVDAAALHAKLDLLAQRRDALAAALAALHRQLARTHRDMVLAAHFSLLASMLKSLFPPLHEQHPTSLVVLRTLHAHYADDDAHAPLEALAGVESLWQRAPLFPQYAYTLSPALQRQLKDMQVRNVQRALYALPESCAAPPQLVCRAPCGEAYVLSRFSDLLWHKGAAGEPPRAPAHAPESSGDIYLALGPYQPQRPTHVHIVDMAHFTSGMPAPAPPAHVLETHNMVTLATSALSVYDELGLGPGTIVALDIDDTVHRNKHHPCMLLTQMGTNVFRILLNQSHPYASEPYEVRQAHMNRLHAVLHSKALVEYNTADVIYELQARGCLVLGLTSRYKEMRDSTIRSLRDLNIDLSLTSPLSHHTIEDAATDAYYEEGIIFTNAMDKGVIFDRFLEHFILREGRLQPADWAPRMQRWNEFNAQLAHSYRERIHDHAGRAHAALEQVRQLCVSVGVDPACLTQPFSSAAPLQHAALSLDLLATHPRLVAADAAFGHRGTLRRLRVELQEHARNLYKYHRKLGQLRPITSDLFPALPPAVVFVDDRELNAACIVHGLKTCTALKIPVLSYYYNYVNNVMNLDQVYPLSSPQHNTNAAALSTHAHTVAQQHARFFALYRDPYRLHTDTTVSHCPFVLFLPRVLASLGTARTTGINVVAGDACAGVLPVAACDGRSLLASEVQWLHDVLAHAHAQWGFTRNQQRSDTDTNANANANANADTGVGVGVLEVCEQGCREGAVSPLSLLGPLVWSAAVIRRTLTPFTITATHLLEAPVSVNDQRWEMVLRAQIMHFLQRGGVVLNNLETLRALRRMAEQQQQQPVHQASPQQHPQQRR